MGDNSKRRNPSGRIVNKKPKVPANSPERLADEAREIRGTLTYVTETLERISLDLEKSRIKDYVNLSQHPWSLIWRNVVAGLARGVGITIGFTFFAATIVYVLQFLGALNLPIVGDYIADIVRIVQRQLEINPH
ncbi:hypothetical protein D7Z26_08750 [Cohnella endophytica]|uniref:Uncharacterized protein n=1 Tax=Cohnella endophytica TaxID=2419778 RepID=A0A494XZU1_9BACL|nr:DUF5665 domain-containing protein [Cohnella endophytica]RKP55288.1 hypothetical protein D7Z26_08750 [Cohnella endophytica]